MHVSPKEKERKMLKKKGSRNTMTLKDFHNGSIPTERKREIERERCLLLDVGRGVFRSFVLVPLKQKSHGRHVIVLSHLT